MKRALAALILATFLYLAFAAGMGGASVSVASESRWANLFSGNATLAPQAGNITAVTHPVTYQLTDRWAVYVGNASGNLTLGNNITGVYQWAWSPSDNGGAICITTNSSFDFISIAGANATEIDTAWGFASDASDNAAGTFLNGSCSVNLSQSSATALNRSKTGQNNSLDAFYTCPLKSPSGVSVSQGMKGAFAFCSPILGATGKSFDNQSADFEIIAPTTYSVGTSGQEIYYFYATLN